MPSGWQEPLKVIYVNMMENICEWSPITAKHLNRSLFFKADLFG